MEGHVVWWVQIYPVPEWWAHQGKKRGGWSNAYVTDVYARGVNVNLTPLTSNRGALATDAGGCSLWRSLLERPPPAPESWVRDPLRRIVAVWTWGSYIGAVTRMGVRFRGVNVTDVYARGVNVNLTPLTSNRGALATDAGGCSLWRYLLERPPPTWESRVRDPLGTRYEFELCGPGRGCYTYIIVTTLPLSIQDCGEGGVVQRSLQREKDSGDSGK